MSANPEPTNPIPRYVLVQRKATISARCKDQEWLEPEFSSAKISINKPRAELLRCTSHSSGESREGRRPMPGTGRWATAVPVESPTVNVQLVHPVCQAQHWVPYPPAHLHLTKTYPWLSVVTSSREPESWRG